MEVDILFPSIDFDRNTSKCRLSVDFFQPLTSNIDFHRVNPYYEKSKDGRLLKIGQVVLVQTAERPHEIYICTAWPLSTTTTSTQSSSTSPSIDSRRNRWASFDPFIYIKAPIDIMKTKSGKSNAQPCDSHFLANPKKIHSTPKLTQAWIYTVSQYLHLICHDHSTRSASNHQHYVKATVPIAKSITIKFMGSAKKNSNTLTKRLQISALLDSLHVAKGAIISPQHIHQMANSTYTIGSDNERETSGIQIVDIELDCKNTSQKLHRHDDLDADPNPFAFATILPRTRVNIVEFDHHEPSLRVGSQKPSNLQCTNRTFNEMFEDFCSQVHVGGLKSTMRTLFELLEFPFLYPHAFHHLGITQPKGIILYGPPGTGKTLLVHEFARVLGLSVLAITASGIYSSVLGETEQRLRDIFEKANRWMEENDLESIEVNSLPNQPRRMIIFIDEIDCLCGKRDGGLGDEMEKRLVAQFLTLLESTKALVVATTNRAQDLDPALRRPNRFDREIEIQLPNVEERTEVLVQCTKSLPCGLLTKTINHGQMMQDSPSYQETDPHQKIHCQALDLGAQKLDLLKQISHRTPGWSGADLNELVREAAFHAMNRLYREYVEYRSWQKLRDEKSMAQNLSSPSLELKLDDFEEAFKRVQPTSHRGWSTKIQEKSICLPSDNKEKHLENNDLRVMKWNHIGGLKEVKHILNMLIQWPILHFETFQRLHLDIPRGILLHGPSGCAKTTLVRSIAQSCQVTFVAISGAEIYSSFLGESEKAIRDVFQKARIARPSIIFFDEIDALVGRRTMTHSHSSDQKGVGGQDTVTNQILAQLLTEMDGIDSYCPSSIQDLVLIIGATNRIDQVDPALLRPGRFDKVIEIPIPDFETRVEILKIHTSKLPFQGNKTSFLRLLAGKTDQFTGADLENLCKEAALCALDEDINLPNVAMEHFWKALGGMKKTL